MPIYTKTGDKGTTSLFEPNPLRRNRVSKSSLQIQAIGEIDEVNSYLGIANVYTKNQETRVFVSEIQKELFQIGAILSNSPLQLSKDSVLLLEEKIDEIEESLPPLRNFIMPEGTESAVHFMYARALTRKAERSVVALSKEVKVSEEILKYLNRLSDYLFVVVRAENNEAKQVEEIWVGKKKSLLYSKQGRKK